MKVILLENISKIGSIGEIIDVKRGYARNFLISQNKALFASKKNIQNVEKIKKELGRKDQERKKEAKDINEIINNKVYEVKKLSTENKELYGSVKPSEISKIINLKDKVDIKSSTIQLINEIKKIGKFKVLVNLHSEIQSVIFINVISEEDTK